MVRNDIRDIKNHYSNNDELLIVGLGDDRGVNFEKNLLILLKEVLTNEQYNIKTIDAFSMLFNKNRHIDYYLKHNISTEQLKLVQQYGTEAEIKHALGDNNFSTFLGVIGSYIIKTANDEKLYLSAEIKNSKEPIIIYSSGINDIMYETRINPFSIKNKYKNDKNAYDYSLSLVTEYKERTMTKIMDSHKSNFENILSLNDEAKICALGAYLYSKDNEYNKPFHYFILNYNESLKKLCREYKLSYVGTRSVEKTEYRSITNTYLKKLTYHYAARILAELNYHMNDERNIDLEPLQYDSMGAYGILQDMREERKKIKKKNPRKYIDVREELDREEDVMKRVMYN